MKRSLVIFLALCLLFILLPDISSAVVTVTATPGSVSVGQTVTVTGTQTFWSAGPLCNLVANYGDGTPTVIIGGCSSTGPGISCGGVGTHTYTSAGSFTVTLTSQTVAAASCTPGFILGPNPVTTIVSVSSAALSVSAIPSQISIPQGQSSSTGIQYQFRATSPVNVRASSSSGTFTGPTGTLSTNNTPVSATITNGFGSAVETIVVPIGLIERVLQTGQNRFSYSRTFGVSGTDIGTVNVNFVITTESAASLGIKKIDLYFEDRRPEITIEKGRKGLKAFADISYAGTGLFEGYWEVDGRIISRVFQQLSFGGLLKLTTPDIPELPTFDPGTHRVQFVITRPTQPLQTPTIIYFVNLDRFKPMLTPVGLLSPQDRATFAYAPQKFEWQRPSNVSVFLIQYGDKLESKALFSAYTRDAFYVLPENVLKESFNAGQRYYWKVIGFDDENNIIGESAVQSFMFTGGKTSEKTGAKTK